MRSGWHQLVERILPWFDTTERDRRDAHTARIARLSARSSIAARRVLDEYRQADERIRRE